MKRTVTITRFNTGGMEAMRYDIPDDAIGVTIQDGDASVSWDAETGDVEIEGPDVNQDGFGVAKTTGRVIVDTREQS